MLELNHVSKTYRSKKGNKTTALNDISLKFGDKGMVFVLGKSGSGKSTLLNVLGGLDRYDSGEIIIQGKSSKSFSNQDFDSYRNTYIGFVFQEFNILEDYSVYRNVALALQLQQQEVDKTKIENLLEKLDLKGFENRKPNELSGGQKQRVAIARALIKDPDIIMADEPTGALDSTTGAQVFEVLKEISKEKLVIVVSHDREAANQFADRIVEFKDGNIIEDTNPEIEEGNEEFKLIRSKLPWKESFKLGLGSLNHKKIRLTFTILLTTFALMFLGLSDTMSSFKIASGHAKLVSENKQDTFLLKHMNRHDEWNSFESVFKDTDINKIKNNDFKTFESYQIVNNGNSMYIADLGVKYDHDQTNMYYSLYSANLQFVELDKKEDFIKEEIIGRFANATDEIVISNYLADYIIYYGITTSEKNALGLPLDYQPKTYEEIVNCNKLFNLGNLKKIKIVGIINYNLSEYQELKGLKYEKANRQQFNLSSSLTNENNLLYSQIFTKKGFISEINNIQNNVVSDNQSFMFNTEVKNEIWANRLRTVNKEISYYNGTEWKKTNHLEKNQMLLSISNISNFLGSPNYEEKLKEYLISNPDGDEKLFFENYIKSYPIIGTKVTLNQYNGRSFNPDKPDNKYSDIEIIGVIQEEEYYTSYLSSEILNPYIDDTASIYGYLLKEDSRNQIENLFVEYPYNGEYSLKSVYSSDVEGIASAINLLKKVAFYASLVFFGFAIFLIMNFIFTSITYRKKEIGILRAIGARSIDVLKIFLWEGILIALISGTLAVIGTILVCSFLNGYIASNLGLILTILLFGIRQIGLIYLTVFVIVFIASLLPIRKIAKMKPIDAILNK